MKITIYKGFDADFLNKVDAEPLFDCPIEAKINVLLFDKKARKQLNMALLSMEENDEAWITYEEFSIIKSGIENAVAEDGLKLEIFTNNLYPDYYPIPFAITDELADEIEHNLNTDSIEECSDECQRYLAVYNTLLNIEGEYFGSFYNYEYEKEEKINTNPFYSSVISIGDGQESGDFDVFINEDVETYLRDLARIKTIKPSIVGVRTTDGPVSKRILLSLQAYCLANNIRLIHFHEQLEEDLEMEQELVSIAQNDIKIAGFKSFRPIRFYKNPDISKETVERKL